MNGRTLTFPAIGFWLVLFCVAACGGMDTNATPTSEYSVEAILTRGAEQLATAQVVLTNEAQTPVQVTPFATIPATQATTTAQAAQATAQAAQPILDAGKKWPAVLSDSFQDNQQNWTVGQDKAVANGKYEWNIQDTENVFRGLPESAPVSDFYAAIDVKLIQGAADCGMGLTFRKNDKGEYIFYVQNDRKWGFDIIHSPDPRISQHGRSDAIVPGAPNRIAVIAQGQDMKFFVNDKYVGQARDATISNGKVGAAVWNLGNSPCHVEFDNFELRVPSVSGSPSAVPAATASGAAQTVSRHATIQLISIAENARVVKHSANMSPDGRHISVVLEAGDKKRVLLDAGEQDAYDDIVLESSRFSPDSSHFAYVARIGEKYTVVRDGKAGKLYDEITESSLTFSPDSQHLAYGAQDGGKGFVVNDSTELMSYDRVGGKIVYSPDSRHLAYYARRGGFLGFGAHLVVVQDEKEGERYGFVDHLVFSPDSAKLAVAAFGDGKWLVAVNGVPSKKYDGVGKISFSPDSQHITFRAVENGKEFAVTDEVESERFDQIDNPHFSPDSRRVAFGARNGDEWYLVVDNMKGNAYDEVFGQPPLFSPDNKHVAYSAKRGAKQFVVLDGRAQNDYGGVNLYSITFSPDSQRLAYMGTKQNHWTMVIDGKDGELFKQMDVPHFSPDSWHVAYVAGDGKDIFVVIDGVRGEPFGDIFPGTLQWTDGHLHYLATKWDNTHTEIYFVQEALTR